MKNILFIICLLLFTTAQIGCSSNDDEPVPTQPDKNKIPDELIGEWKINYFALNDDPDFIAENNSGFYIKFNVDNTIEFKDLNGVYKNNIQKSDNRYFIFPDANIHLKLSESTKFPGQTKFTIYYNSGNNIDNYMIGVKKQ